VLVPYTTAQARLSESDSVNQIWIQAVDENSMKPLEEEIIQNLRTVHRLSLWQKLISPSAINPT
jgi:hypothetical protein